MANGKNMEKISISKKIGKKSRKTGMDLTQISLHY